MSNLHRIGVISDTHVPSRTGHVPEAALGAFEDAGVELILHAGDLSTLAVIDQLEAYAPVVAVQGNVEQPDVVAALPIKRELMVGGCAIGLVHILGERAHYARNARHEFPDARIVVFGHSHILYNQDADGLLPLNSGSATDWRSQPVCTVAILTLEDGRPQVEIVALP
jgi:uncharacterized protein